MIVASQLPKRSCVTPIRANGEGIQTLMKFAADYCNRWSFPKTPSSQKNWGGQQKNWEAMAPPCPPVESPLYTVRSCASRSSTPSKKYRDSVVKARLAAEELNAERELARQKIQEVADRAHRAKRHAEERARIDVQRAREQAERAQEQAGENAQRAREEAEDERLCVALPWRYDYQILPDNIEMARKRLTGLKRRFQINPEVHQKYTDQMRLTIQKGYAEEVPKDEIDTDRRKWYIPHHGVFSERKPDKLRIVFDCAAQHRGVSLNQVLMQGPDLNNRLDAALLHFRKESIALVADVEAIFHQVLVSQFTFFVVA